jgi:endonuclease YncB( thermonuclease family)
MRIPIILLALLLILAILLYRAMSEGEPVDKGGVNSQSQTDQGNSATAGDGSVTDSTPHMPRPIAPKRFAQPFAEGAVQLERIAPRQPLTPPPPKDNTPKRTLLHRPVVTASGLITYKNGTLRLAGIEVVDPQEVCTDQQGIEWPCGIIARTAFRNFLRGRALSCNAPAGRWEETVTSQCIVGNQDPAVWLVSHGWVRPTAGSDYAALEQAAKDNHKGLYGSDPRNLLPVGDSGLRINPLPAPVPESLPEPPQ